MFLILSRFEYESNGKLEQRQPRGLLIRTGLPIPPAGSCRRSRRYDAFSYLSDERVDGRDPNALDASVQVREASGKRAST